MDWAVLPPELAAAGAAAARGEWVGPLGMDAGGGACESSTAGPGER